MAVTGIGGVFFRAKDPDALLAWYKAHLGVTMEGYEPWQQQAGPTVFMPFASNTDISIVITVGGVPVIVIVDRRKT